jgi:DNA-directed RNA polymerase subunit M/transcription elongation factor TFIIS
MKRDIIECPTCGKTVTPEEVEAGISLVCLECEDVEGHTATPLRRSRKDQKKPR